MTTIDVKQTKSAHVTEDNNIFPFLESKSVVPLDQLSSISFTSYVDLAPQKIAKKKCFDNCIDTVYANFPTYSLRLLASNSSWQPNTAIVKHLKLWGALKRRVIDISNRENTEVSISGENGVKFFGEVKMGKSDTDIALQILAKERMSFVICLPNDHSTNLDKYIDKNWAEARSFDYSFWTAIITYTCLCNGIFLRIFGEFDDREVGVTAVMLRKLFDLINNRGHLR